MDRRIKDLGCPPQFGGGNMYARDGSIFWSESAPQDRSGQDRRVHDKIAEARLMLEPVDVGNHMHLTIPGCGVFSIILELLERRR